MSALPAPAAAHYPTFQPEENPELLSAEEAATELKIDISYVRRLVRQKKMVAVRIGRRILITRKDLNDFIKQHRMSV